MLDSFIGGIASSGALIALIGLIIKVWPAVVTVVSTWLYAHVDPGRLPYDNVMNRHWAEHRQLLESQAQTMEQIREDRKDTIKNTLMSLMELPGDQSIKVRYELSKLEDLQANCWIMQEAEQYLNDHHNWRQHDA